MVGRVSTSESIAGPICKVSQTVGLDGIWRTVSARESVGNNVMVSDIMFQKGASDSIGSICVNIEKV